MATEREKIKELVKERYGARAERVIRLTPVELDSDGCGCSTGGACCGVEDLDHAMLLYNEGQLAGLPTESFAASAGSGNPTALAGLQLGERVLDLGSGGGIDCFLASQQVGETGHVTGPGHDPGHAGFGPQQQGQIGHRKRGVRARRDGEDAHPRRHG